LLARGSPRCTPFPYTTLFRSGGPAEPVKEASLPLQPVAAKTARSQKTVRQCTLLAQPALGYAPIWCAIVEQRTGGQLAFRHIPLFLKEKTKLAEFLLCLECKVRF